MRASKITAVDFFEDLTSRYARRRFFWAFVGVCVVCGICIFAISHFVTPSVVRDLLFSIFIEIISGAVIVLAFYAIYIYFIGPHFLVSEVSVLRPRDIGERIESLPLEVSRYMFWGRSGSYFRAHPLRYLDSQAKEKKRNIDIEVVLPDPEDPRLVNSYNEIVRSLGETPSENQLLANVLATSIACAIVSSNNKFVNIRIFYSPFLPAFRVDLSDKGAVLTQDDPNKSALFFQPESEFYEMFRTTVRSEMSVSKEVKWEEELFKDRGLDEEVCDEKTLGAFGLKLANFDALKEEVAALITERQHRYK